MSGGRAFQPTEPARRRAARANLLALIGFIGFAVLVPLARAGVSGHAADLLIEAAASPLAGVAAWLVWRRIDVGLDRKRAALRRWGWLMMLGALWPAIPAASAPLLTLGVAMAGWTVLSFRRLRPVAALLLLPFAAWLLVSAAVLIARFGIVPI